MGKEFYAYEDDCVELNINNPSTYFFKFNFTEDYVEIFCSESKVLFWKVKADYIKLYYDEILQVRLWATPHINVTMNHKKLERSICKSNKYGFCIDGMDKELVSFLNDNPQILNRLNAFNVHDSHTTREVLLNVSKRK